MKSWDKETNISDNFPTLPRGRQRFSITFILAIILALLIIILSLIVVIQGRKRERDSVSGATVGKAVTEVLVPGKSGLVAFKIIERY